VPGVVAGLIPWTVTHWHADADAPLLRAIGAVLVAGGVAFLLHSFARFAIEGIGTPAPVAPTEQLVVGGVYRYVRNPMYLAVGATIVGQALFFGRASLLVYAALFGVVVFSFVHLYEEPTLEQQFGESYDAYRRAVPGWLPRLHAWKGD
jgi:protein-S-isoprenylcysteine O-methyltransferase Ste14